MKTNKRTGHWSGAFRKLPLGAFAATAAMLASSGAALAQDSEGGLTDIVVTAQKRQTNLQDTPISIAVISSQDFANRHAQSLEDFGDGAIPSLRVAPFFSRSSALTIGMRGVGGLGDANQPSRDQGVGVYLDGVYLGRAQGLGAALLDVERIEVLKGPQGTLFGRNTEGGAISIVTKKPTGEFGLGVNAGIGNFESRKLAAHLNLPAIGDLAVKIDGLISERDGTIDNPLDGAEDFNGYDKQGARLSAAWRPSDALTVDYAFDASTDRTSPYFVQLITRGTLNPALAVTQPTRTEAATIGVPMSQSSGATSGHAVTVGWRPNDMIEFKSITSYRKLGQSQRDNGSVALSAFLSPNSTFGRYSLSDVHQRQFSQEVQLIGETAQLHYVAGAFYYREVAREAAWTPNTLRYNANGTAYTVLPAPLGSTPYPDRDSDATTKSSGVFAQATWTPALLEGRAHLTAGGRYTNDQKVGHLSLVNGAPPVVVVNGVSVVGPQQLDKTWSRFDPMVTMAFDLSDDVNVYGKYSTGYKAGGANSRSLTYRAFDPETVTMWEAGLKSEFLDRRVRLNLAAYTGDYEDVQVDFNAIIPGNNRGTLETTNTAGKGDVSGYEAELTIAPISGLTFTLSGAHTEISLPKAPNPFVTGSPLVPVNALYAPENAASAAIDYSLPLSWSTLRAHIDANYSDGQYTSTSDATLSQSSTLVNARLALADLRIGGERGGVEVAAWARNLTDEEHLFVKNFSSSLGTFGIYNEPRTYGVELSFNY